MQKPQIQLSEVSCHIIKLTMKLSHYYNQSFFLPFIKLNNPAAPIRSAPAPITLRRLERVSLLSPVCGNSAWEIGNDRLERVGNCKSFSSPVKAETISFLFSSTACLLATGRGSYPKASVLALEYKEQDRHSHSFLPESLEKSY